jgi:hypothetical protein
MTKRHRRTKVDYRKIYEEHFGPIPYDADGRRYEIHHRDGNDENNDPSNLVALTIQEHYDLHYDQGDYFECYMIMNQRMSKSPEELSRLATLNNLKRVANGTNPLVGGALQRISSKKYWEKMGENHPVVVSNRQRINDGTHHLLKTGSEHPSYDSTEYSFVNTNTGERVTMTQNDFLKKYDLHSGSVSDMVNNKRGVQSVNGWKLIDPLTNEPVKRVNAQRDNNVYEFVNKKTGKTVSMTREQLCSEYKLSSSSLCEVIHDRGQRKSVGGWSLKK